MASLFPTAQPAAKDDYDSEDQLASADQNAQAEDINALGAKLGHNASDNTPASGKLLIGTGAGTSGWTKDAPTGTIVGTSDAQTLTNKQYQLTAAPADDHTVSGLIISLTAAANVAFGDVCYINSSGKAALIDADAIASMSGCVMAIASISADAAGLFLLEGVARDDTWNWTVGGLIYGTVTGTTGNTLSQTAPSGTDDVVQIMGVATHADRMLFKPQLVQVEVV